MSSELATTQNFKSLSVEEKGTLAAQLGISEAQLERAIHSNPGAIARKLNLLKQAKGEGGTLDVYTFMTVKPHKEGYLEFIQSTRDNDAEAGKKTKKSSVFNTSKRTIKVTINGERKFISHRFVAFAGDPIELKLTARMTAGDGVDVLEGENPYTRCQAVKSIQFGETRNDSYPLDPSQVSWDHFLFKKDGDKNTIIIERDEEGNITGEVALTRSDFASEKDFSESIRLSERAVNPGKVFTEAGVKLYGRPDPVWAKRMGQDEGVRDCETCLANSWFQERDKKGAWNRCGIEGSAFFLVRELLMPHPKSAEDIDEIVHSWVKVEDLHLYGVEGITGPFVVMIQISNSNFKASEGVGEKGYKAVPTEMVPMPNKYAKGIAQYWRDMQRFDPNRFDPFMEIDANTPLPNFVAAPTIVQLAKRTDTELGSGYVIVASKDENEAIQAEAHNRAFHANVVYLWEKSLAAGNEKPEDRPKFETEFYHSTSLVSSQSSEEETEAVEGVVTVDEADLEGFLDDDDELEEFDKELADREASKQKTEEAEAFAVVDDEDDDGDVLFTSPLKAKAASRNGAAV